MGRTDSFCIIAQSAIIQNSPPRVQAVFFPQVPRAVADFVIGGSDADVITWNLRIGCIMIPLFRFKKSTFLKISPKEEIE